MSNKMPIQLTTSSASEKWGDNPLLSNNGEGFLLRVGAEYSENLQRIQQAGRRINNIGIPDLILVGEGWKLEYQWAFTQGFSSPKNHGTIEWAKLPSNEIDELNKRLQVTSWVRKIINRTSEDLPPVTLAESAAKFISELSPDSVTYTIISGERLKEEELVGIYGVGRGSDRPPALLKLEYCPPECADDPVSAALVGKGITFDSGGYSIKSSEAMLSMKYDMGGAATVTGALGLAILQGLKKRVSLFLCCAENLISGHAYKLGDILKYKNGVSVEIVNTDAEGRLVLADGLILAGETGAPLIIDAATLTGAAMIAVGGEYNALLSLDTPLRSRALEYATQEFELHWPLPLEKWHQNQCPSAYADTANSRPVPGGGPSGASNAAGFLSRFVPNDGKGWLHFDLAAAFKDKETRLWSAGATAMGVRTIARTLLEES